MKKILVALLGIAAAKVMRDDAADEAFIKELLGRMNLDEKIGQMLQPERRYCSYEDATKYYLGSVLSGGGSWPSEGNTPEGWSQMYDAWQKAALATRLGIPLIYGQDAVHGVNNIKGATVFPHNIGLGCANDPELVRKIGVATAEELSATGTTWAFSPCLAVARDDRWGRTYESYSEDPTIVTNLGGAYIAGLQAPTGLQNPRITACAKHFVGDGGAEFNTGRAGYMIDRGDSSLEEEEFRRIHLAGYYPALEAGVGTVMASYSSWKGKQMHHHKYLLTDVLKNEMGFDGFVISDYDAVYDLEPTGNTTDQVINSINAGVDMMMVTTRWKSYLEDVRAGVESGQIPMERVDDAVLRILRIKKRFGLFENPLSNSTAAMATWGSPDHRALAREAVRKSAVLLKNDANILPLAKNKKILVAGKAAESIGYQCGGWTIEWQGSTSELIDGTNMLEAITAAVGSEGTVTYDKNGKKTDGIDVAIVVLGEKPYAEGKGDSKDLALTSEDQTTLKNLKNAGIPTVAIILSGRPVIITEHVDNLNGIVAAFLPGTEGDGIADLLFGAAPFSGKLSFTWPKSVDQEPINVGDATYDPLYAFGHGLTTSA